MKPSLNKAYDFIEKGGFTPLNGTKAEISGMKRARATLKVAWKEQAISGPLLFASQPILEEDSLEDDDSFFIYDYAPDDPECFDEAQRFVQNRDRVLQFFGEALHCQEKIQRLLDPDASAKLRFPAFPKIVSPIDPGFGTWPNWQSSGHTGPPNSVRVGHGETQPTEKDLGRK